MRVLHVLDRSLPTVAGYTTRSAAILEQQAALGLAPRALTGVRQAAARPGASVDGGGGPAEAHGGIAYLRTDPFDVQWMSGLAQAPVLREGLEMAALRRRILAVHAAEPFDLLHAHSPILCGIPGVAAARRLGLPSVYEIRAFWEDAFEQRGHGRRHTARYAATRALETRVACAADAVVTICQGLRRDLARRGVPEDRLFVVPNAVDTQRFAPRPRDPELEAELGLRGKTVVGYVGTFAGYEGVPLLLAALGRLCDARDDVRGLVVGHGEAEAEIRGSIEEMGLGGRVVLLGKAPPAAVPRYYALADVLCYPRARHRITELVTPLKPLEAMSMGKAVVGSDVGGLAELIDDGETGLLFPAGDAEALAAAIARLVGDDALRRRLGEQARARTVAERSIGPAVARYLDVYAAAAEHQGASRPGRAGLGSG